MLRAISLARRAEALGEVPIGALIVGPGEILAESFNLRESTCDPLGHAELLAIKQASEKRGAWRLEGTTLYVTLEPCVMCAGAIVQSRISRVVFGAADPKGGAVSSLYQILSDPRLNHRPEITAGVEAEACGEMLTNFFRRLREGKQK